MQKETYKIPATLECWYLTGDSQVRIYLRPVPAKKRRRLSVLARLRIRRAVRLLARLLVTAAIMVPVSIIVVEAVRADRGYWAVGGEWLFLGFLAVVIFKGTGEFF